MDFIRIAIVLIVFLVVSAIVLKEILKETKT